jgi:hypothetical protein
LGDFFERRKASAANGVPLNDLITFEKGGPANNGPGFYKMDWKNWQPSVAAAWSPNFKNRYLKAIFGGENKSVLRGGFRIASDHFGEQLAVSFNGLSTIGFTESNEIAANTYNVTDRLAPLFTGFGQAIRGLPGVPTTPPQKFSTDVDPDCLLGIVQCPQRIESSLDSTIKTPKHYTWNVSWGRQLPGGMYFEASYIGRIARHLLASRDVNAFNNLVDKKSGMDWYTAAGLLADLHDTSPDINTVKPIPYFENLFPNLGANFWGIPQWSSTQAIYQLTSHQDFTGPFDICGPDGCGFNDIQDWTFIQTLVDDYGISPNMFVHPQYAAFSAFSSVANSSYHGATFSLRQRLGQTLSYDINYTLSKSFDNASGLQTGSSYGSQFILNALRPQDNHAYSDFDVRHSLNANFIFQLPFGKGRQFFKDMNKFTDVFLGGWQLTGIYRYNSGLPLTTPFDANQWATNWNAQSAGTQLTPVEFKLIRSTRNAFADPQAALNAIRNARPGETGQRNAFRLPGYSTLDLGLSKSFTMPWSENHKLQLRWEVFNVMNYQYLNTDGNAQTTETYGLPQDSPTASVPTDDNGVPLFGNIFTSIQGVPRRMQFGLRYSF